MTQPRFRLSAVFLLAALWVSAPSGQSETYTVTRIVDGDTVVLAQLGTVRLIGVDTPETVDPRKPVQYFGREAAEFLQTLLRGQLVRVEYERSLRDRFQRTLAYLYLPDGTFVNLEIVLKGYGHAYLKYPFRHAEQFRAAERQAREGRTGLWANPSVDDGVADQNPAHAISLGVTR